MGPAQPAAGTPPIVLVGVIQSVGSSQITVALGSDAPASTATFDLSSARLLAGKSSLTATSVTIPDLHARDRVYAVLSATPGVVYAEIKAGTPLPVTTLYDVGALPAPTPPTPTPPASQPVVIAGKIASIGAEQITVSVTDTSATAVLDLSNATILIGSSSIDSTRSTVADLKTGDRVYAVVSVGAGSVSSDEQSGTLIPVTTLYDIMPAGT